MLKKYWPFIILILMILGLMGLWHIFQSYRAQQATRVAKLQEKAAETQVTIIEGWTTKDIAKKFEEAGMFSSDKFLTAVKNFDYANYPLIIKPSGTDLEGYLFPDTYRFAKDSTPTQVIEKLLDNFTKRMSSIDVTINQPIFTIAGYETLKPAGGDNKSGMSLYDILTLASIIELESGSSSNMSLAQERALIAGVFYNRLMIGQALESDATVNYVTGKHDPGATAQDTQVNSPYNTYRYAGLPPGPIGNPSLGSIEAALRPTQSDYYYFLHKQPSGEAVFSKTFADHIKQKQ